MKKSLIFSLSILFLMGFVSSASITGSATLDNKNVIKNNAEIQTQTKQLTQSQIQKIIHTKNKLKIQAQKGECPNNCTCTGSIIKCQTPNGREMIIKAGKSGNTIFQTKGINASTKVELYKAEGKFYGVFKGNKTRVINIMPDQIKEKIQERLKLKNCSCEIELNEDGEYNVQAKKRARFLGLFPIKKNIAIQINPETGEIIKTKTSWWGFLAKDIEESQ